MGMEAWGPGRLKRKDTEVENEKKIPARYTRKLSLGNVNKGAKREAAKTAQVR
jgi:hypothetical protein